MKREKSGWLERLMYLILVCILLIVFVSLAIITYNVVVNQRQSLEVYTNASNSVINEEEFEIRLEYLNALKDAYKSNASTEAISFLYSFITSVLIGLASGIALKLLRDNKKLTDEMQAISGSVSRIEEGNKLIDVLQKDATKLNCIGDIHHYLHQASVIASRIEFLSLQKDATTGLLNKSTPKLAVCFSKILNLSEKVKQDQISLPAEDKMIIKETLYSIIESIEEIRKTKPTLIYEEYRETLSTIATESINNLL